MTYRYIQTEKDEDGYYCCEICGHAFEDEGEVCWADELFEGQEYSQSTGLPLCGDCCDEVRELANQDECEICSGRFCIDEMESIDDLLVCTECYEKELAKKNDPITINAATLIMYRFCAEGEFDEHPEFNSTADEVREFWQSVLRYNSECYDEAWFSLIATPAIEKTINWHFIVTKYREARCIKEKKWFARLPENPAKDAHFALCAARMAAGEITCDEAIALHKAAFPSDD
tara:strand:+ start:732 stop:1424 length:693 start_codon:yes stop_codon:yes gene_type:complete